MPHPRGGLTKAQRLGGLTIGKLLKVAEQDDLAIPVIHMTKYGLKSGLKLMPDRLFDWLMRRAGPEALAVDF